MGNFHDSLDAACSVTCVRRRIASLCRVTLFCLCIAFPSQPVLAAESSQRWSDIDRVVIFGDVHGAYESLLELLRSLDVIDAENRWTGGSTHLVSLGDLLDRGPDSRAAMDLLMRLQSEAAAAGGSVHVVLGNHELMNLTGDLRYVSPAEYAAFADEETAAQRAAAFARLSASGIEYDEKDYPPGYFAHRAAFAADGRYGRWLLAQPAMVIINDNAFVHGGFPDWMTDFTQSEINAQFTRQLTALLIQGQALIAADEFPPEQDLLDTGLTDPNDQNFLSLQNSPLLGGSGPLWYRGTAYCHPLIESTVVERTLQHFDVSRLVMGHSPTRSRDIQHRFDDRVLLADTGMLKPFYHGQASAVVIEAGQTFFAYPEADRIETITLEPIPDRRTHYPPDALAALFVDLQTTAASAGDNPVVSFQGMKLQPVFFPGNARSSNVRQAAFQLDQLLGFGMVPPTVAWRKDGKSGTLSLLPANRLTEVQRSTDNGYRPQWCETMPDYQLMYAFDALTANKDRTQESILYDSIDWSLMLLPSDNAFGTGSSFPEYLDSIEPQVPRALATKLAALTLTDLEQALSPLLSSRQIRALDKRRQRLLQSWQEVH